GCRPVGRCADAAARSAGRRRGHAAGGRRQLSPRRPDPAAPGGPRRRRGAGAAMMIRITWMRGLLAVAVLATLGLGVAWSGIINIGASTGHWVITDRFLHWAMRNSVRTQS